MRKVGHGRLFKCSAQARNQATGGDDEANGARFLGCRRLQGMAGFGLGWPVLESHPPTSEVQKRMVDASFGLGACGGDRPSIGG